MEKIYEMELHEVLKISGKDIEITRVPGGWIYYIGYKTTTFVPFNLEFKERPIDMSDAWKSVLGLVEDSYDDLNKIDEIGELFDFDENDKEYPSLNTYL